MKAALFRLKNVHPTRQRVKLFFQNISSLILFKIPVAAALGVCLFFPCPALSQAQGGSTFITETKPIEEKLDELLSAWYIDKMTVETDVSKLNVYHFKPDEIPEYPDAVYKKRLEDLQSPIPLGFNPIIKRFIDLYAKEKRNQVENMLGLSQYYFPIFETELNRQGLPLELKYIPIIESALNNAAVSKSGATGLWQFMYPTARLYGLQITSYIDERKDPYKLTEKAVTYLKDMYAIYRNWLFVIAAYNCGPGSVNKAIQKSGYKTNFWEVYPFLPVETRGYIPAFIAANYIMNYHVEHNLYPKNIYNPGFIDTIQITRRLRFEVIARALQAETELLEELNPQYIKDVIPQSVSGEPFILRLPVDLSSLFNTHRNRIYRYQDHLDKLEEEENNAASKIKTGYHYKGTNTHKYKLLKYRIKAGDSKQLIADLYECTLYDLKRWNPGLDNSFIVGKELSIYVSSAYATKYSRINELTATEKTVLLGYNPTGQKSTTNTQNLIYTVKHGDTLWGIANRYPGISATDIINLNKLDNNNLVPGQKIKIPLK